MRKRERSVNFTLPETRLLVDLVIKHKNTIECKRTDAITWKAKSESWQKVCDEFNAQSGLTMRSVKNLQIKYDGLKKELKKKTSKNQSDRYKTGGGEYTQVPLTDYEEKLLAILYLQVCGLPDISDCDIKTEKSAEQLGTGDAENITIEIVDYSPQDTDRTSDSTTQNVLASNNNLEEENNLSNECLETPSISNNWSQLLKRKSYSGYLKSTRKKKQTSTETVNNQYSALAEKRDKLVNFQLEAARKDIQCKDLEIKLKQQEYENTCRENERKEEKHSLEMKILLKKYESHK